MSNLFKIKIDAIWPPVSKVEVLSHNPEDIWRVEVNQILPPIYRVNINLNILDLIEKLKDLFKADSKISLHTSKPLFSETGFPIDKVDVVPILNKKEIQKLTDEVKEKVFDKKLNNNLRIIQNLTYTFEKSGISDSSEIISSVFLKSMKKLEDLYSIEDFEVIHTNKGLNDVLIAFTDVLIFESIKILKENVEIEEILSNVFGKDRKDDLEVIDSFLRISSYLRSFNEFQNIDDDDVLGIIKGLSNDSEITDILEKFEILKDLKETSNTNDHFSRVVDYNTLYENISLIQQLLAIQMIRPLSEELGISEEILVALILTVFEDDIFNALDHFSKISEYVRKFFETIEVNELFTRIVYYNKGFADASEMEDAVHLLVINIRNFSESIEIQDGFSIFNEKIKEDVLTVSQKAVLLIELSKSNTTVASDLMNISEFIKNNMDQSDLQDFIEFSIDIVKFFQVTIDEKNFIFINKPIVDNIDILEFNTIDFEKNINDLADTIEGTNIGAESNNEFIFIKGINLVSKSVDQFLRVVDYNKIFENQTTIDVDISKDFSASYTEEMNLSELILLIFITKFSDGLIIDSSTLINSNKFTNNETDISDSGSLFNEGYVLDMEPYFAERYVGQEEFF